MAVASLTNQTSDSDDDIYCGHSIKYELRPLLIVMCSSGTVSAVLTLITISAMIFFRLFKLLTHRLILNMLVGIFLFCIVITFQFMGLWHNSYWKKGEYNGQCVAGGFFLEYTGWVMLVCTLTMTVHLTSMVLLPTHYKKIAKLEPLYLIIPWIFSIFIAWIPFIHNNYGMAGSWCWIRVYRNDYNCTPNTEGLVEMYVLAYGELTVGLILNNISLLVIAIMLCKRACFTTNEMSLGYRKALKHTLPLVVYPITYLCITSFAVADRLYQVIHGHNSKWLMFADAASTPFWGIFAPILTLIYFMTISKLIKENIKKWWIKCCKLKKHPKNVNYHYIGSKEDILTKGHFIDPEDRLTYYGTATVTSPTGYDCGRESEIDEEYERN